MDCTACWHHQGVLKLTSCSAIRTVMSALSPDRRLGGGVSIALISLCSASLSCSVMPCSSDRYARDTDSSFSAAEEDIREATSEKLHAQHFCLDGFIAPHLTGLHVEQQVLAVPLRLLHVFLHVPPFSRREQAALLAVSQEVGQVRVQVTQSLLPLRGRLAAHLTGSRGGDGKYDVAQKRKVIENRNKISQCSGSIQRRS